jgi:putative DNA primase/helicase
MTTPKRKIIRRATVTPLVPRGLRTANEVEETEVSWLWEGYFPAGMLVGLIGDGGLGKSLITLDLVARLTTGRDMPDGSPGVTGAALVLSTEDMDTVVKRRLMHAGADLSRVYLGDEEDESWEFPRDAKRLERDINRLGVRLVILDPVKDYTPHARDRDDKSVRQALVPLRNVAQRTSATIVIVRHVNKGQGKAAMRGAGSVAWRNVPRAEYAVATDPDDGTRCLMASNKNNVGPAAPTRAFRRRGVEPMVAVLDWEGVSPLSAEDLFSSVRSPRPRDEAETFLRTVLAHGARPSRQVKEQAAELGIAPKTLERAREAVGVVTFQKERKHYMALRQSVPQT